MQKKILYTLCSVYRVGNIMHNCGTVSQPGRGHWYHPETLIRSLVWEDLLEKEMATCSIILSWRKNLMDIGARWAIVHRVANGWA